MMLRKSSSHLLAFASLVASGVLLTGQQPAGGPYTAEQATQGKAAYEANCASCHAIDRSSESPLKAAPPFRTLHKRYPVEALAEALAEGISTGHPAMPEFSLAPAQIGDLIAFLKTLE